MGPEFRRELLQCVGHVFHSRQSIDDILPKVIVCQTEHRSYHLIA
jgi:hypothetical protein